jgi:hypothetical protein
MEIAPMKMSQNAIARALLGDAKLMGTRRPFG